MVTKEWLKKGCVVIDVGINAIDVLVHDVFYALTLNGFRIQKQKRAIDSSEMSSFKMLPMSLHS